MAIEKTACNIPSLVAANPQLKTLDQVGVQAAKNYILALILNELGGADYRDICALATSLRHYDRYSKAERDTAMLTAMINVALQLGVTLDDAVPGQGLAMAQCAHCCDVTQAALENSEALLWCLISEVMPT